jgi:TRAP-type C4-dicarboxylate transport system permease small subunit
LVLTVQTVTNDWTDFFSKILILIFVAFFCPFVTDWAASNLWRAWTATNAFQNSQENPCFLVVDGAGKRKMSSEVDGGAIFLRERTIKLLSIAFSRRV